MSGHNKWSKIKRQKGAEDAQRSKLFGKLVRFITVEAKKANGNVNSPGLQTAIKKAKEANMPNDTIDRAIKKSTESAAAMENITYEAYGPGGSALVIEALTDNRNKASQEIKHILSKHGFSLAGIGAATWAFEHTAEGWIPQTMIPVTEEADKNKLMEIIGDLEENDEVQEVYTNAE
jgi:YebC/PmpR family DNA-binding regulatory protein